MNANNFCDLSGLKVVVTGSTSGIGREVAREFANAGAELLIHGRQDSQAAQEVRDELSVLASRVVFEPCDLSLESELPLFVERCWQSLGSIDIWINNAGADLLTGEATTWSFTQKLQRLYEVDVRSTVLLSRLIGQRMQAAGGGVILNVGWDQADRGMEGDSGELFATAKNAVMGFTRSLAVSLAPTVRVNCIAPGWIRTKWGEQANDLWQQRVLRETPLKRWGTPQDVAVTARFLCSREASYLTGQVININGGAER